MQKRAFKPKLLNSGVFVCVCVKCVNMCSSICIYQHKDTVIFVSDCDRNSSSHTCIIVRCYVLTGCVGTVSPASEVVLQQLVGPGGTGPRHQPHGGLVEEHLEAGRREKEASSAGISTS